MIKNFIYAQVLDKPYQIPGEIYVGDSGKLVFPLDDFFLNTNNGGVTWEEAPDGSVTILAAEINRNAGNITVTFQAWRTGAVMFPAIIIGGEKLSGLQANINSVLEKEGASIALLPQKEPLAAPGAFWIISLFVFIIFIFAALVVFVIIYGKNIYKILYDSSKVRRPRARVMRSIKKLKNKLKKDRIQTGEFLAAICREFRVFISILHTIDCYALTPNEFYGLNIAGRRRLSAFLSSADEMRFSGRERGKDEALVFADEMEKEVERQCGVYTRASFNGAGGESAKDAPC
ncbi:MAG: hypothetical protein LBC53_02935 [Spirochaetaceae bacterium]|jgi:hypothetical protein|nr:hypothetical protein [Spirochaetaceae bacterium]